MDQTPSSGDCEVAAERRLPETETLQFDTEIAAPDSRLRTPTGTGASSSTKSANGSRASRRMEILGRTQSLLRLPRSGVAREGGTTKNLSNKKRKGATAFCAFFGRGSPFVGDTAKKQNNA